MANSHLIVRYLYDRLCFILSFLNCQNDVPDLVQPYRYLFSVLDLARCNQRCHNSVEFFIVLPLEMKDDETVDCQRFDNDLVKILFQNEGGEPLATM